MSVVCVIQARTGSRRLPGKVLAEVAGRPLLRFMLDRLERLPVDRVVVATSEQPGDDAVVEVAADAGVPTVRGPEDDVLGRFAVALAAHPAEHVVRLTGDCPLVDPEVVVAAVRRHVDLQADYTSNTLPRTYPKGLDVEVASASSLAIAIDEARDPREREHVMPFLYRHPERFRLANLRQDDLLGDERWVVDTADDLAFVQDVARRIGDHRTFGWRDVLEIVGRRVAAAPGEVRLRPAVEGDAPRILAWRNDPDAIRNSSTGRAVDPAEHATWFARCLEDPATRLLIGERDGEPVGQVRVDVRAAIGEVSITVDPHHRGQGLGTQLLGGLRRHLAEDFQVVRLEALVLVGNDRSRHAFERAGFDLERTGGGFHRFSADSGAQAG